MVSQSYKEFVASRRREPDPRFRRMGSVPADEPVEVSIYLKPRRAPGPSRGDRRALLEQRRTEHAGDFQLIREFAARHGLRVIAEEPGQRLVRLAGTAAQAQDA